MGKEIDLRDNNIFILENLNYSRDNFDSINLSDNYIMRLMNFPIFKRLRSISINNNKIFAIDLILDIHIPNIEVLIITNNGIEYFEVVMAFFFCKKLKYLSLSENPVFHSKKYPKNIISFCKHFIWLDFSFIANF